MRALAAFLTTACLLLAMPLFAPAGDIVLVGQGKPNAALVIPRRPSPAERFAAEEIRRYVMAISGATLPIVPDEAPPSGAAVSIGNTALARGVSVTVESNAPDDDLYLIKSAGQILFILGKGDRGTVYGAYRFLEKHLGCRWVFPGKLGDIVPPQRSITVHETNELRTPAFRFRIAAGFNSPECVDWAIKQGLQVYSPEPADWQNAEMVKRGGYVKGTIHHAFQRLFPPEQYFAEHPEYYGLVDGKRVASANRGQLCVSNPEVVRLTAEKAIRFFDENPDGAFFSLCPDDHQNWCQCPACAAYDSATVERWEKTYPVVTDRLMAFVNKVGEQLEKRHPGKMLYVFAYQNYTSPPVKHLPRANVIVSLCHMVPACYAHALDDPNCEENVKFMRLLSGWTSVHNNMWFYAYTCKSMWEDMPWPIARRLARDIRTLHAHGFQGFYSQGSGQRWGQLGVNMYLMAKVLWDLNTDDEAVLSDYFAGSFGPAAGPMKDFYDTLEHEFSKPGIYIHHEAREQAPQFLTPAVFQTCFARLDAAEKAAHGDKDILARIKPVRVAFEYARLYLEADRHEKAFRQTDGDEEMKKAIETYLAIIELQKTDGVHAISPSCIKQYIEPPLERLQREQFTRTGQADGMHVAWDTQNLLANPSFEQIERGEPVAWQGIGAGSRGTSMLRRELAHSGQWSLLLRAQKKPAASAEDQFAAADWVAAHAVGPKIPVKQGETYRLMAWVNVPEGIADTKRGVVLGFIGYDDKGESPSAWAAGNIEVRRTKPTQGWQRMAIFKRIDQPDVRAISPRLGIAGTGRAFLDDVELVKAR